MLLRLINCFIIIIIIITGKEDYEKEGEDEGKRKEQLGKGRGSPLTQIPVSAPATPRLYNIPSVNSFVRPWSCISYQ